jgi:uronate dehydrogenase
MSASGLSTKRRLAICLSPRDCAQLVTIGVEHPEIRFEIVYGMSGNSRSWYDNSNDHSLTQDLQGTCNPIR